MMICCISGEVPEEPVVSKISGLLFEKRLIERHISDHGKCPVTGEPLTMNDIIPIKTGNIVNPRPVQDSSIPGMPAMFQNELEQQLHTARQELSHALYKHDLSCRVISRLMKERDKARALLMQSERQIPTQAVVYGEICQTGFSRAQSKALYRHDFSSSIISKLNECNDILSQQRKKRVIPPTLTAVDTVERYTQLTVNPLHQTNKPGILSLDILHSKDIIATAGNDSNAVIFDRSSGQVVYALSGHSKKVTSVKFVGDGKLVVTASADKTVRLWQELDDGIYDCAKILKDHKDEVKSVTIHPTNSYFATASLDGTWCFYDLASGLCLTKVDDDNDPSSPSGRGYTCTAFHPDGLILGNGTADAVVKLWDVKSQVNVASCPGHSGAVRAISFSENGYILATAAQDGVRLWDLRKLKNFQYHENTTTQSVEFDYSGSCLALGGSDIRVYQVPKVGSVWNCINIFPDLSGTRKITCLKFGNDAKYIAVGSMDRYLRIFGLSEEEEEVAQLMRSLKI